ncbi:MAG: rRNA maturation RNase YbeY [Clostridiales Family XIII bacterium]|jgi:probable rRNA maturation factor|nr:rRNA maturation RNase YbeY [Clostridiales Family XIII bacterium]
MIELSYDAASPGLPPDDILAAMREAALAAIGERGVDDAEISLSFVSPSEIRALNGEHRGAYEVTDVLSFPMDGAGEGEAAPRMADGGDTDAAAPRTPDDEDTDAAVPRPPLLLGDIVICPERARGQAAEYGHGEPREFVYLFVHGLFHLLGYDHGTEEARAEMRAAEEKVMRRVNL